MVATRTRLLVVRHGREAEKSTNTARIAALALPSLRIVDYRPYADGDTSEMERALGELAAPALLFPGGTSALEAPPSDLVVLDGTWRQARKMLKALPALAALPRLSLPPLEREGPRLRHSPHADNLSTLQAIAAALGRLEGPEKAEPLFRLHDLVVERVFIGRGYLPRPS